MVGPSSQQFWYTPLPLQAMLPSRAAVRLAARRAPQPREASLLVRLPRQGGTPSLPEAAVMESPMSISVRVGGGCGRAKAPSVVKESTAGATALLALLLALP